MFAAHTVICGAGILGLTIARELIKAGCGDIIIFDKELAPGKHASGRNSGVLHAGIYYDPGTLKAKMCLEGNLRMQAYCEAHGLPLFKSGKVIVARTEDELPTLDELERRATANGATVEMIDETQLAEIEPNARTVQRALHSPLTSVVDPKMILTAMRDELERSGKVRFFFDTRFTGAGTNMVHTSQGDIGYDLFINAAGAYSDKVAQSFGIAKNYRLLPFKGIYKVLRKPAADKIRGSIYPVPNIKNPFLGVHFTRSVHGDVYVGPTAIPAFGRENYGILKGLDSELLSILSRDLYMFMKNEKFRQVALEEPRKYSSNYFFNDAAKLVKHITPHDVLPSSKAGIRPQLVDIETNELVMDFVVKRHNNSVHILNSISPAFTSSMYFAELVVKEYTTTP
ncbi:MULTISPECIES: L-2-hydroxyglutarate oxidase [unclassified Pseudodesulfovibrio]|uniref:L-2-hydroxyglutarate oxidase n=1 Tax=unclassified Pseudodesulfovibrio TaxID=2661612 RepID=UPI000FEBE337|nr:MULTISPECIES: L-2-hydroxyglutarate oxidase [unclassified Pseudodesulfovibrio]MCJ2163301.1 L-2-hydroxyglutarate oxidase [Pseudodesulfovibrio sp. S3-i]RWU07280.1 L-2-hydroxyglutarate oxidase [Pseudodesulfovibrio sp. S3]